jgi:hypothetical protein
MDLKIGDSALKAQVVWAFGHHSAPVTMSGLRILEGSLPLPEN